MNLGVGIQASFNKNARFQIKSIDLVIAAQKSVYPEYFNLFILAPSGGRSRMAFHRPSAPLKTDYCISWTCHLRGMLSFNNLLFS